MNQVHNSADINGFIINYQWFKSQLVFVFTCSNNCWAVFSPPEPMWMLMLQLLRVEKVKPGVGFSVSVLQLFSLSSFVSMKFCVPWTSTLETACFCCTVGRSYNCKAADRCPVMSRISLSGTPVLNIADVPVALKLWFVLCSKMPASLHIAWR